jgi:hypothetical protein
MDWSIDYLENEGIVITKLSGIMNWDEHKKWGEEAYSFLHKHGSKKMLIDFQDMEPDFTTLQIDDLPKMLQDFGIGPDYKIAGLYDRSSPHAGEFTFFRNSASLSSINVRYFDDKDQAIAWLKSGKPDK